MTQANIPLLTGPVNVATLGQTLYNLTLAINDSGIGSAPIVPPPQPLRGSFLGSLNDFILSVNAVTAAGTVALLARPISPNDLRNIVNNIILQINAFVGGGGGYVGPLDLVPGAAFAYSQRALSAAMRGAPLYTIREDGGDTTQSFDSDETTGDAPVAAITAFLAGANGFIATWNDQSGNGVDAVQATKASQLPWIASSQGTKPAVGSNGGDVLSSETVTWSSGQVTLFVVMQVSNGSVYLRNDDGNGILFDTFNGDASIGLFSDTSGEVDATFNGQMDTSTFYIVDFTCETGAATLYANGAPLTLSSLDSIHPLIEVMGNKARVIMNTGAIQEPIMYLRILSDPDRLALRENIASYYGITLA